MSASALTCLAPFGRGHVSLLIDLTKDYLTSRINRDSGAGDVVAGRETGSGIANPGGAGSQE